jgi:hypothetical protein
LPIKILSQQTSENRGLERSIAQIVSAPEASSKSISPGPQKPPYSAVALRAHRDEIFKGLALCLSLFWVVAVCAGFLPLDATNLADQSPIVG